MPDQLNKQSLINLLIDSPLREPIKINLIDIVNNTSDPDLPKVFSTITKELEIFQKATERRMKLADETIAKLGGTTSPSPNGSELLNSSEPSVVSPTPPLPAPSVVAGAVAPTTPPDMPAPLSVPPLDLPPLPTAPGGSELSATHNDEVKDSSEPSVPTATPAPEADEAALTEIQKELDSLKTSAAADAAPVPPATPAV